MPALFFLLNNLKEEEEAQSTFKALDSRSHTLNSLFLLITGVEFEDLSVMCRRSTKQKHDILGTHDSCSSTCSK